MPDIQNSADSIKALSGDVLRFATDRDWLQFHSPKNLSMSIAIESAELMELFQWQTADPGSPLEETTRLKAAEELADVLIYCLQFANVTGIDVESAIHEKLKHNHIKYPVELAKGSAKKYTELKK
jgi:dCTP diphosphatase